jgi:hypothetical protein
LNSDLKINTMQNNEKITGLRLYMIMLGMLIAGTCNTILMKI